MLLDVVEGSLGIDDLFYDILSLVGSMILATSIKAHGINDPCNLVLNLARSMILETLFLVSRDDDCRLPFWVFRDDDSYDLTLGAARLMNSRSKIGYHKFVTRFWKLVICELAVT